MPNLHITQLKSSKEMVYNVLWSVWRIFSFDRKFLRSQNSKILHAGEQTESSDIEFVDCLLHNFDLLILRGFEIYDKMQNIPMSKEVHIYRCSYQLAKKTFDNQLIYDILFTNLHISYI